MGDDDKPFACPQPGCGMVRGFKCQTNVVQCLNGLVRAIGKV